MRLSLYVGCIIEVDDLNRVIGQKTHQDDAHIDMNRSKFVLLRIYNHVKKCKKTSIAHPMLIVIGRYIIWGM